MCGRVQCASTRSFTLSRLFSFLRDCLNSDGGEAKSFRDVLSPQRGVISWLPRARIQPAPAPPGDNRSAML
jgi:hypothetical protein